MSGWHWLGAASGRRPCPIRAQGFWCLAGSYSAAVNRPTWMPDVNGFPGSGLMASVVGADPLSTGDAVRFRRAAASEVSRCRHRRVPRPMTSRFCCHRHTYGLPARTGVAVPRLLTSRRPERSNKAAACARKRGHSHGRMNFRSLTWVSPPNVGSASGKLGSSPDYPAGLASLRSEQHPRRSQRDSSAAVHGCARGRGRRMLRRTLCRFHFSLG